MSQQTNITTIVRIKEVLDHDTFLFVNIGDAHAGVEPSCRSGRSRPMALGGVDTYWRIKIEPEHREGKSKWSDKTNKEILSPRFLEGQRATFPVFRTSTNSILPAAIAINLGERHEEPRSIKDPVRLLVGFRPSADDQAETAACLFAGTLKSPLRRPVDAIEVAPREWIRSLDFAERSGFFELRIEKSAVPIWSIDSRSTPIEAGNGIVLFPEGVRFKGPHVRDFRTDEEVVQDTDRWLARISDSLNSSDEDRARIDELRGLLQKYAKETIQDREINDLSATLKILEKRPIFIDMLPEILARDKGWAKKIKAVVDARVQTIVNEFEARFTNEAAEKRKTILELDAVLTERRSALALIAERERAYRDSIADVERTISAKVTEELSARSANAVTSTATMEDLLELKAEIERLSRPREEVHEPVATNPSAFPTTSKNERLDQMRNLAKTPSMSASKLALAVSLASCGVLPVFVGSMSDRFAIRLGSCISGSFGAVVFCDPTLVSIGDILSRSNGNSASSAVDFARAHPDAMVAVILCGLTRAPCEFWLPAIFDGWRVGLLPENLRFFATASPDGIRVPMPKSLLASIVPLEISGDWNCTDTRSATTALWPYPRNISTAASELRGVVFDALDVPDKSLRSLLGDICRHADAIGIDNIEEFVGALRECVQWWGDDADAKAILTGYFRDFEER